MLMIYRDICPYDVCDHVMCVYEDEYPSGNARII